MSGKSATEWVGYPPNTHVQRGQSTIHFGRYWETFGLFPCLQY